MDRNKKIGAVIVAAGTGSRMGEDIPKQFLKIKGRPMVFHSVWAFISYPKIHEVVLVTGEDHISLCHRIFPGEDRLKIVAGGRERGDSVRMGLAALSEDIDYVLVHDGARPYVGREVIDRVLEETQKTGAAIPAVTPKDTIRSRDTVPDRNSLFSVQTPQGFRRDILIRAYADAEETGYKGTDDASYVEQLGIRVSIVQGEYANVKITTKDDMPPRETGETRVGCGYDVHRLTEDRRLILGGVDIPHSTGLAGHSDGDVLIHAIMDSLLGAAAMGDIGELFPDTDPAYEGISSLKLLEEVGRRLDEAGFVTGNIDATVMAQRPKLARYKDEMKENISRTLGVRKEAVNIKATTTEKLGFVGREEGIAAEAVCILIR